MKEVNSFTDYNYARISKPLTTCLKNVKIERILQIIQYFKKYAKQLQNDPILQYQYFINLSQQMLQSMLF